MWGEHPSLSCGTTWTHGGLLQIFLASLRRFQFFPFICTEPRSNQNVPQLQGGSDTWGTCTTRQLDMADAVVLAGSKRRREDGPVDVAAASDDGPPSSLLLTHSPALIDVLAAAFPGTIVRLRTTCSALAHHPALFETALNRGALRGLVNVADDFQARVLRVALSVAGGRLREAPWVEAVLHASTIPSTMAVEALLAAYPRFALPSPLFCSQWSYLSQRPTALRVFLRDGRLDPRSGSPTAADLLTREASCCATEALAAFLEDARIGPAVAPSVLRVVCRQVAHRPDARTLGALRLLVASRLCDADTDGAAALLAAASAHDAPTLQAVLHWWPSPSDEAFTAALVAASGMCTQTRRILEENYGNTEEFYSSREDAPPYSSAALTLLLAHCCRVPREAAVQALGAACQARHRDAILAIQAAAGGVAAVPPELACRALAVVARADVPSKRIAGRLAVPEGVPETEAAEWVADAPFVCALLSEPRFDPQAPGGGPGLLARAAGKGRLGLVQCLLADGRFFTEPPPTAPAAMPDAMPDVAEGSGIAANGDALACAARSRCTAVVDALLACPHVPRSIGSLVAAAEASDAAIVEKLLAAGIAPSPGALCAAARVGSASVLSVLLDRGGDPCAPVDMTHHSLFSGRYLETPLRIAVDQHHASVIRLLLSPPHAPAVLSSEQRLGDVVAHACFCFPDVEHDNGRAALECLRVLVSEPRFDANAALEPRLVESLPDEALALVLAAPSFDPTHPFVAHALVTAASKGRTSDASRVKQFLADARIDPSASDNRALVAACASVTCEEMRSRFEETNYFFASSREDEACYRKFCELRACNAAAALLRDTRVSSRAFLALEAAAASGSTQLVRLILAAHPRVNGPFESLATETRAAAAAVAAHCSTAIERAASLLDGAILDLLCRSGLAVDEPHDVALRNACATWAAQRQSFSDNAKLTAAFERTASLLLRDHRVSPAPAAPILPRFVQTWAVRGGLATLTRAAAACPDVLRSNKLHVSLVECGAFGSCDNTNFIAVDYLLSRRFADFDALFTNDSLRQISVVETVDCLRRALKRGNLPADVILELVTHPSAPDTFVSCALLDVVSATHSAAYGSCCALPLSDAIAHAFGCGALEEAFTEELWCEFELCAKCVSPPLCAEGERAAAVGAAECAVSDTPIIPPGDPTSNAAAHSPVTCDDQHCLGTCCSGDVMLARVQALLMHPRVNPAESDSLVLFAAASNSNAPSDVLMALLCDGRADPQQQPRLLEVVCSRDTPCPGVIAALLAHPRVAVTESALAVAACATGADLLSIFFGAASLAAPPTSPASTDSLQLSTPPLSLRSALAAAAKAGRNCALRRLLCMPRVSLSRRAIATVVNDSDVLAALIAASGAGHADCVVTLLQAGCRLCVAAGNGQPRFAAGAALTAAFSRESSRILQCSSDMVAALVRPCSDAFGSWACPGPHCSPEDVQVALRIAAPRGYASAIRALLAADQRPFPGASSVSGLQNYPLVLAARTGSTQTVLTLLDDRRCWSCPQVLYAAADVAARRGDADTVYALLVAEPPLPVNAMVLDAALPPAALPPDPTVSFAALRTAALYAAIDGSHDPVVSIALAARGGAPSELIAAAVVRVCERGNSARCLNAVIYGTAEGAGVAKAALAQDDSAALRRLCALRHANVDLVAAVLRVGRGAVDPAARNCEALRAAARVCNAGVVGALLEDERVADDAAAAARTDALLGAVVQEGSEGVAWLLAPRIACTETLLVAAELCARRGDTGAMRAVLGSVELGQGGCTELVARVRALGCKSDADSTNRTAGPRRAAAIACVITEWLKRCTGIAASGF